MCGVPQHAAEAYLARLIRRGFRVAVAEQMEDPKSRTGKAPIRREVVRLVTPGTITEEALLEAGRANLLLGLAQDRDGIGAAWLDVSTGLFETAALAQGDLPGLLGRLEPAEILAPAGLPLGEWADKRAPDVVPSPPLVARRRLAETFGVASLDAFGSFTDAEAIAALMAVDYVRATQAGTLPRLARPAPQGQTGAPGDGCRDARQPGDPPRARRRRAALAARHGAADADPGGSAAAGGLAGRAADRPCGDRGAAGCVGLAAGGARCRRSAAGARCGRAPDIARALGRLSVGRGGPRDLAALRDGLRAARAAEVALCVTGTTPPPLAGGGRGRGGCADTGAAPSPDPPARGGGVVARCLRCCDQPALRCASIHRLSKP